MTFLEICKQVHGICQIDGDTVVSVNNQTGMNARVIEWVNRAYSDIQLHRTDWKFRQELASLPVAVGQWQIGILRDDLEYLDKSTITGVYPNRVDKLTFVPYDVFYDKYQSKLRKTGKPNAITVANNNDIYINPIPTEEFTLNFWYTKTVDVLEDNTDIPIIRNAYQDSIVWKAVVLYAEEQEAINLYQTASMNYKDSLNRMELDLRPEVITRFTPLA